MNSTVSSPHMDRIVSRLLLTLLAAFFFAALGMGLQTAGLFDWYLTVAVLSLSLFWQLMLRGPRLDPPSARRVNLQSRFEPLRNAINEIPLLQKINTATTYKLALSFALGLVLATFVQNLSSTAFAGLVEPFRGMLALFVVLAVFHFVDEVLRSSHTYERPPWVGHLKVAALHAVGNPSIRLSPITSALAIAGARAMLSVILRGIALALLPQVFSNGWMVTAAGVGVVLLVAGFDSISVLSRALVDAFRAGPRGTEPTTRQD